MKTKCAAHYGGQVRSFEISSEKSLLDELRKNKVPVPFSCGGAGICTTCKIVLVGGSLSPRTGIELERAMERDYREDERLSCQCFAQSETLEVKVP